VQVSDITSSSRGVAQSGRRAKRICSAAMRGDLCVLTWGRARARAARSRRPCDRGCARGDRGRPARWGLELVDQLRVNWRDVKRRDRLDDCEI
jgi:hypothetical protein